MSKSNEVHKGLTRTIFVTLPDIVGLLFGDPLTKGIAITNFMSKGFDKLSEMNKEWWEKYLTALDAIYLIEEQIQSPEFIQFIRKIIQSVTYETRLHKRELLLSIALNYHTAKHFSFDKKMYLLGIFDNLSELELLYILRLYGKTKQIDVHFDEAVIEPRLASFGLLNQDFESINRAFEKMSEQNTMTIEAINRQLDSVRKDKHYSALNPTSIQRFNYFFDKPRLTFRPTTFGYEFVEFITNSSNFEEK